MAKIRVTPQTLRQRADELETLNNRFNQEVGKLKDYNSTMGNQWKGDARTKFNEEFTKDVQKFDAFQKGILDFIRVLRSNADEYDRVENSNTSIARVRKA